MKTLINKTKKKIFFSSFGAITIIGSSLIVSACFFSKKNKLQTDKSIIISKDKNGNFYLKLSTSYDINKLQNTPFKITINNKISNDNKEIYPQKLSKNNDKVEFYLRIPQIKENSSIVILNPTGFFEPLIFKLEIDKIQSINTIEIEEGK